MAFKDLFTTHSEMEMTAISGELRVEIRLKRALLGTAFEITGVAWFACYDLQRFHGSILHRVLVGGALLSAAVGLLYFLTRTEVIEFDRENLTIRRGILGWGRVSRYSIRRCSELTWSVQDSESKFALECKFGWRKIRFAHGASEEQAQEIIERLQRELPDVAQELGKTPSGTREHITRLGLS